LVALNFQNRKEDDVFHVKDIGYEELRALLESLPRNLHWDKWKLQQDVVVESRNEKAATTTTSLPPAEAIFTQTATTMRMMMDIVEEGFGEDDEELSADGNTNTPQAGDEGLEIAWQYKQSVQHVRLGTTTSTTKSQNRSLHHSNNNVFCHSYDLSGRMMDQTEGAATTATTAAFDPFLCITTVSTTLDNSLPIASLQKRGRILFRKLVEIVQQKSHAGNGQAIRMFLYHPPVEEMAVALPLLLSHIRKESLPVVVLMCTTPTVDITSWTRLARNSDIVLSTEGFASRREYPPPPEFRHLRGVLKVIKTTKNLTGVMAWTYGFRRDRRKLHIQLLHIPPEDYADHGGSVGAGGIRSGAGRPTGSASSTDSTTATNSRRNLRTSAGMGCSANLSGSILDF
jgi:hypothetical protein